VLIDSTGACCSLKCVLVALVAVGEMIDSMDLVTGIPELLILEGAEFGNVRINYLATAITGDLLDQACIMLNEKKYAICSAQAKKQAPFLIGTKIYVNSPAFCETSFSNTAATQARIAKYCMGLSGVCEEGLSVEQYEAAYMSLQVRLVLLDVC